MSQGHTEMLLYELRQQREEVKDLKRLNAALQAALEANAVETIELRNRYEELWRVKTALEDDVTAWKAKYDDIANQTLKAVNLLDKAAASITQQHKEIRELTETIKHRDCQIEALKQINLARIDYYPRFR